MCMKLVCVRHCVYKMRVVVNPDGALDMEPAGNVATVEDRSKKSLRHFSLRHGGNIISRLINLLMRGEGR